MKGAIGYFIFGILVLFLSYLLSRVMSHGWHISKINLIKRENENGEKIKERNDQGKIEK